MRPYFVSELSCNHLGSLDRALQLVDAAANVGANAIKLQTWSEMVISDHVLTDGPWAGRNLKDLYAEAKTPWEWHETLFERARHNGIEAFSSVFDLKALAFLEKIGCPRYKISSFELVDLELIRAVAATGKPMIMSTGMATRSEIQMALDAAAQCKNLVLLKCSSAYPAPVNELNLSEIPAMAEHFGCGVGFSDHTIGHEAAVVATALGATVIEKHLTLSRRDGGPDAGFSVEPGEFYEMVQACKAVAEYLPDMEPVIVRVKRDDAYIKTMDGMGEPDLGPTESEKPQLNLRRSLYFAKDMKAGEIVSRGTYTTARPALGLEPYKLPLLIGKTLAHDVEYGKPMQMEDFQ